MNHYGYTEYVLSGGYRLFTVIVLPYAGGKFPTVIKRNPYVSPQVNMSEEEILAMYLKSEEKWLNRGYAVVFQHCRGKGKSEGECIPFVNEREDSLNLHEFVRNCDFYNGELYLWGGSYCCEVHYETVPFADDIKGAILRVRDTERYSFCYRNGIFKTELLGNWYVSEMYKTRGSAPEGYDKSIFNTVPLSGFSEKLYGEPAKDLEEFLLHPDKNDPFWDSHLGGGHIRNALKNIKIPVLLETSWYDIFEGGIFDMWNEMSPEAKSKCALLVSAFDHHDNPNAGPIRFENASRAEKFGREYDVDWIDFVRGKKESYVPTGKVTYYNLFAGKWVSDDFSTSGKTMEISLGDDVKSYIYNPENPAYFPGGLSSNFGGVEFENPPFSRDDIITVYSEPFTKDTFVKGNIRAKLNVASDCDDTCFYMRLSITKEGGDYGLREDITNISGQVDDYIPGSFVSLDFEFDEHAFLVKKGEKIRIDITSSDANNYVRHTNYKGLYSIQDKMRPAKNTVDLSKSYIEIPIK